MNSSQHDPALPARDPSGSHGTADADPSRSISGLEEECLVQAIHDLRGPLNTTSILLDLAVALAAKEGALVGGKLAQVVQELRRVGRMLDQLVATSDSLAAELVPLEVGAAVAAAATSCRASARGVALQFDAVRRRPLWALSCPIRLARALASLFERCLTALPDGGEILVATTPHATHLRLVVTLKGSRVAPPADHKIRLTDGSQPADGWFPVRALIRGIDGNIAIEEKTQLGMRIVIDLPQPHPSSHP